MLLPERSAALARRDRRQRRLRVPVINGQAMSRRCPLYPQKQTLELSGTMSALCQKRTLHHSINSSARASSVGGTWRPSALAVHALEDKYALDCAAQSWERLAEHRERDVEAED